MKVNIEKDRMAMRIICMAIGEDTHVIDKFDFTREGEHEIRLTCDGVELDFSRVIHRLDEIFDKAVEKRAGEIFMERVWNRQVDKIEETMTEIANQLKQIRDEAFPGVRWDDD